MSETRAKAYVGLATVLSTVLIGHWRFGYQYDLYDAGSVPLVVKLGLTMVALGLAFRGYWLRNEGQFVFAAIGIVVTVSIALLLTIWVPTGFLGPSRVDTLVAAIALAPLVVVLLAIQKRPFDPLGWFLGGPW